MVERVAVVVRLWRNLAVDALALTSGYHGVVVRQPEALGSVIERKFLKALQRYSNLKHRTAHVRRVGGLSEGRRTHRKPLLIIVCSARPPQRRA